jgi:23S rRNA pseudouridine2605 synthase
MIIAMRLLLVACATTRARALSTGGSAVRLEKFLNDASVAASRAACTKLVKQGRVAVDGVVAKRAAAKVAADARVTVDGVAVEPLPLLWAYHKPVGVHSTLSDDRGRPDLSTVAPRRSHPVGRLDADTSGLLLFSSDGALTHKLLSPRVAVEKEYVATCDIAEGADAALARSPEAFLRDRLAAGVQTTLGVHVGDVLDACFDNDRVTVRLVVREGKHRMVRRMLANVGCPVVGLQRERVGDVRLGALAEGAVEAIADDGWAQSLIT